MNLATKTWFFGYKGPNSSNSNNHKLLEGHSLMVKEMIVADQSAVKNSVACQIVAEEEKVHHQACSSAVVSQLVGRTGSAAAHRPHHPEAVATRVASIDADQVAVMEASRETLETDGIRECTEDPTRYLRHLVDRGVLSPVALPWGKRECRLYLVAATAEEVPHHHTKATGPILATIVLVEEVADMVHHPDVNTGGKRKANLRNRYLIFPVVNVVFENGEQCPFRLNGRA